MLNFFRRCSLTALGHGDALSRIAAKRLTINTIIDVGAAKDA